MVLGMAYDQGVWPWGLKIHVTSTLVGHLSCSSEQEGLIFLTYLPKSICRREVVWVNLMVKYANQIEICGDPCRAPLDLERARCNCPSEGVGVPQGEWKGRGAERGSCYQRMHCKA